MVIQGDVSTVNLVKVSNHECDIVLELLKHQGKSWKSRNMQDYFTHLHANSIKILKEKSNKCSTIEIVLTSV